MLVDCNNAKNTWNYEDVGIDVEDATNYGCDGGWMHWAYDFVGKYGIMAEEDYPYTAVEGSCYYDSTEVEVGLKKWKWISSDTAYMRKDGLQKAPLSIAMAFGGKLSYYSSGVVPHDDDSWCSQWLNHAITIVGYEPGEEKVTEERTTQRCRARRKKDADGCRRPDEYVLDGSCCRDIETTVETSTDAVWKIQNSWGSGWGDEGYFYGAVGEGSGLCGMNTHVFLPVPDLLD